MSRLIQWITVPVTTARWRPLLVLAVAVLGLGSQLYLAHYARVLRQADIARWQQLKGQADSARAFCAASRASCQQSTATCNADIAQANQNIAATHHFCATEPQRVEKQLAPRWTP